MIDTQNRFLYAAVVALLFLGALFTWSTIYRTVNTFSVGSAPALETETEPPALPPVRVSDPRLGSTRPDALEVVEFADYRCLHCRAMAPDLLALATDAQRNIRLIWREAPTQDQSDAGLLPFAAARCAYAQGKFGEMHAALFQLGTFTETAILEKAAALRLDQARFRSCLSDKRVLDAIRADQATALVNRISAAPTLFVRGIPYVGQQERSQLEVILR